MIGFWWWLWAEIMVDGTMVQRRLAMLGMVWRGETRGEVRGGVGEVRVDL